MPPAESAKWGIRIREENDVYRKAFSSRRDVFHKQLVERAAKIAEQNLEDEGAAMASRFRAAVQHHSSPVDAAEVARDAGVARLVITHFMPGIPENYIIKGMFLQGVAAIYKGSIKVAKDGDWFYLPPAK